MKRLIESFSELSTEYEDEVIDEAKSKNECIFDALVDSHQEKHDLFNLFFGKKRVTSEKKYSLYQATKRMLRKKRKH